LFLGGDAGLGGVKGLVGDTSLVGDSGLGGDFDLGGDLEFDLEPAIIFLVSLRDFLVFLFRVFFIIYTNEENIKKGL
jgi:hypothetical protein